MNKPRIDERGQIIRSTPPRIDERGQIVRSTPQQIQYHPPVTNHQVALMNRNAARSQFLWTTLIVSPILYGIAAPIVNEAAQLYYDPALAIIVGALFGLIISGIYDATMAKDYTTKDYFISLAAPGLVLAGIFAIIAVIVVVIAFAVLGGMLSGG
jgi:hypothetical protein